MTAPAQMKSEGVRAEPAIAIPIASGHLHLAAQSVSPMHDAQTPYKPHRTLEIAAQVLQRMDAAAPAGSTQLHADARRLEVGVTAGSLGWVEVRATTGPSGRVDAILHVQSDASAHILSVQSPHIASFVHEHSIQLGQLSVGVGAGNSDRRRDPQSGAREEGNPRGGEGPRPMVSPRNDQHANDRVTLISLRA